MATALGLAGIQEMLHLQLASNMATAIGCTPDFTSSALQANRGWSCYGPKLTVIPHVIDLRDTTTFSKTVVNVGRLTADQLQLFVAGHADVGDEQIVLCIGVELGGDGVSIQHGAALIIFTTQRIGQPFAKRRLIVGDIVSLEPAFTIGGSPTLTVRGYDRRNRLNGVRRSNRFPKLTDAAIAQHDAQSVPIEA